MNRRMTMLLLAGLLGLTACSSSTMVVATRTSVGVGITASTVSGASSIDLGYSRAEVAVVPLQPDGTPPPDLFVSLGYRVGIPGLTELDAAISQVLATGSAAEIAAGKAAATVDQVETGEDADSLVERLRAMVGGE